MQRRAFLVGIAATLLLVVAWASGSNAAEIQLGGKFEVKANSIWFEDAGKLAQWQRLKKTGSAKALASYQEKALANREAWQFVNSLTVKIIGYERAKRQVKVR